MRPHQEDLESPAVAPRGRGEGVRVIATGLATHCSARSQGGAKSSPESGSWASRCCHGGRLLLGACPPGVCHPKLSRESNYRGSCLCKSTCPPPLADVGGETPRPPQSSLKVFYMQRLAGQRTSWPGDRDHPFMAIEAEPVSSVPCTWQALRSLKSRPVCVPAGK